jgi:O-methyltransferase
MFKKRKLDQVDKLYEKYNKYTMVPKLQYRDNLELILSKANELPSGDFVECGVWRGGISASISEILNNDIKVHLFDSFEGLPNVDDRDGELAKKWQTQKDMWYADNCSAEESFAIEAFRKSGNNKVEIYKGWFENTLKDYKGEGISILRMDADWYSSTKEILEEFYDKVLPGGIVIIDDFYMWEGCTKAVYDFLSHRKISDRVRSTPNDVAYIIKDEVWPLEIAYKEKEMNS